MKFTTRFNVLSAFFNPNDIRIDLIYHEMTRNQFKIFVFLAISTCQDPLLASNMEEVFNSLRESMH